MPSGLASKLVTELYADLFHRQVTTPELSYNVKVLDNGSTVEALVGKLVASNERKSDLIVAYYEAISDPVPNLGWLVNELALLNKGLTTIQLQETILASPEFQGEHVTNASYVTALYEDVLGPAPSSMEESTSVNALTYGTDGTTRATMQNHLRQPGIRQP